LEENLAAVIGSQDAVLLGRRTYDEWARFWPNSDIEPFATFINGVQKYVATSSALDHDWANAERIDGDLAAFVAELKHRTDGDVGVHGSIALAQALLGAGLVDRLRLVVAPSVHVRGRRLFDDGTPMQLSLARCVASPKGYLVLDYEARSQKER
jgi:dihydrofolate reductase